MTFASIRSLVGMVEVHAKTCPRPTIEDALVEAAQEFCTHTEVHWESVTVPVVPDTETYTVPSPDAKLTISRLMQLPVRGYAVRDQFTPDYTESEGDLVFRVALMPADSVREFWEPLTTHYAKAITTGALSRVLKIPGAWASPDLAMHYNTEFADHLHNHRIHAQQPRTVRQRGNRWL